MERVVGLISSLWVDVASSQDVPFHQPQYMYHGLIVHVLLSSFLSADNARCSSAIAWYGFSLVLPCFVSHILQSDLDSLQRSFLQCCSFVTLCNEWVEHSYTNEVQWPPIEFGNCTSYNTRTPSNCAHSWLSQTQKHARHQGTVNLPSELKEPMSYTNFYDATNTYFMSLEWFFL